MRNKTRILLAGAALLLAGCTTPNFYPGRFVEIMGDHDAAADIVAKIAVDIGFEHTESFPPGSVVVWGAEEKEEALEEWHWKTRPATRIVLSRGVVTKNFDVEFADNMIGGFDFTGATCTKYLEFSAEMKRRFGERETKLKFGPVDSCEENY